ncbi:helix-turn-helix domain-containing protein [Streptomyces sp. NPDC058045]|uniref:helix-turn-helix domain-containing protein n=1 Tax=Streptomyces sp. NPDC058045 TaxID=3346311 RepID=UPI0036EF9519
MHPPPPFHARAARTMREKLGMAPGHVAYGMRASYGMTHITPDHITAWERGAAVPEGRELAALAGVLWCSPGDLMGTPHTLREHRLARGLAAEDIARSTGLPLDAYLRMEETGEWTGDRNQSATLGELLGLPPRDFIAITGQDTVLAGLLTDAVSTRWQAHIRAIGKLTGLDKRELRSPLQNMHQEYQSLLAATLSRAGGAIASGEEGRRFLEDIVPRFWDLIDKGRT